MTAGNHGAHGDDHVFDDLPALLNGELSRAETGRVSDHLRACDDCRQDLVLAVSASAALRSAVRFAPTVMEEDGGLPDPSRFLAELALGGPAAEPTDSGTPIPGGFPGPGTPSGPAGWPSDAAPTAGPGPGAGPGPYPPGVPALDPTRTPRGRHARRGPGGRSRARWTAAAAALLLVAGVGAGVIITRGNGNQPGGRQIALSAVGPGSAAGSATLRGNDLCVNPTNLARPAPGHSYEVWLVDPAQPKLLPVGMTSNGQGCWTLPADQVGNYNTVEISDEPDDGNPAYSGKSVLRGRYS